MVNRVTGTTPDLDCSRGRPAGKCGRISGVNLNLSPVPVGLTVFASYAAPTWSETQLTEHADLGNAPGASRGCAGGGRTSMDCQLLLRQTDYLYPHHLDRHQVIMILPAKAEHLWPQLDHIKRIRQSRYECPTVYPVSFR